MTVEIIAKFGYESLVTFVEITNGPQQILSVREVGQVVGFTQFPLVVAIHLDFHTV